MVLNFYIHITEQSRPVITLNPASYLEGEEYSTLEAYCAATGVPTPRITWQRLNGEISQYTTVDGGILRFEDLRQSDSGEYLCQAYNDVGSADSILSVNVITERRPQPPTRPPVRPTQRPPPASQTVQIVPDNVRESEGANIILTCGRDRFAEITWSREDGVGFGRNVHKSGNVLRIEQATETDSGTYVCTEQVNRQTRYGHAVVVIVRYGGGGGGSGSGGPDYGEAPEVTQLPSVEEVVEGTDYSISCEARGTPYPTIVWTLDGRPLDSNVKQIGNKLQFYRITSENHGHYICTATNSHGSHESAVYIEIDRRIPPIIEIYPTEPQTVDQGGQAVLSCRYTAGHPTPVVTWTRRDGRPLSSRFKEEYEGTLKLEQATLEDDGQYICRGENAAGSVTQTTILTVTIPPEIKIHPDVQQLQLAEGEPLNLVCSAKGKPEPSVYWVRPYETDDVQPESRTLPGAPSTLHIARVTSRDGGYYSCIADNNIGRENREIEVIIDKYPNRGDLGPTDYSTSRPVQPRPTNRPRPPAQYPEPEPQPPNDLEEYIAFVDERTELSCKIEGLNARTSWRRADNRPLPYNSRDEDGALVIEKTNYDASGVYECWIDDGFGPEIFGARRRLIVKGIYYNSVYLT